MSNHTQTIWARLDDVRVSDRRGRAVNAAKVARYRDWLEQGRVAPPVRLTRNGDVFVCATADTASQQRWPQVTP